MIKVVIENVAADYAALFVESTESDALDSKKIDLLFSVRETAKGIDFKVTCALPNGDMTTLCEGKAPMEVYRR